MITNKPQITNNNSLLFDSFIANQFLNSKLPLIQRAPRDSENWQAHTVAGKSWLFAQPITLTPYIATQPCSACCLFCSENLRTNKSFTVASKLRPDQTYFKGLQTVLAELEGLPLSYSISGLEATDNIDWLLQLLNTLDRPSNKPFIEQKVLYSNGNGFAGNQQQTLLNALLNFNLSWLELSRHHFDDKINQQIMRFKLDNPIASNKQFTTTITNINNCIPVKLVCILQKSGIDSPETIYQYLNWALQLGINTVIFREMSRIEQGYRTNNTLNYIQQNRICLDTLLTNCLQHNLLKFQLEPMFLTDGYYFWNIHFQYQHKLKVIFECSDYDIMQQCHNEDRVYKLVYFANGQLCADWQPNQKVLMEYHHE